MNAAEQLMERVVVPAVLAVNAAVMVWGLVDPAHRELAEHAELACLAFFGGEVLWRWRREGWRFWRDPWNVFDVAVVTLAVAPLPVNTSLLRLVRLARVARLLHLGRHVAGLRILRVLARRWEVAT